MKPLRDSDLDLVLRTALSGEREVPVEVDRAIRRAVRTQEPKNIHRLFAMTIVLNAVMTLFSESAVFLLLPYLPVRVLAVFHVTLSMTAVLALIFLRRRLFVFLEGVYNK